MIHETFVGKLGEMEYISLKDCYDLNNGYSTLFNRAIHSFDIMIIEHGYTYKKLCKIWNNALTKFRHSGLSLRESEIQGWLYFLKLRRYARRKNIHLKRNTSSMKELINYYEYSEAKSVILHYIKSKKSFRKMRSKSKNNLIKNVEKKG